MPLNQVPTVVETDRIAAIPDPAFRNILITQCYFDLSAAVARRTGPRANWCTFATWASKQAGQTIRQEDLPRALEHLLFDDPEIQAAIEALTKQALRTGSRQPAGVIGQRLREIIDPKAAMARSGAAVGRGNQKVFAEIGREFARFIAECLEDAPVDPARIDRFCAALRPGGPPDGQQYLQDAFRIMYDGLYETDEKKRAEMMLCANLLVGFHEQTRLQPEIAAALEAAIPDRDTASRQVLQGLFPKGGWLIFTGWWILRRFGLRTDLDRAIDAFLQQFRIRTRLFLTKHFMEITVSKQRLKLGRDVDAGFPAILKQLHFPALLTLLGRIDPTPDSLRDSGAIDWADLPDRMHFIADLFRSYQESAAIMDAPFDSSQVDSMKAGRMPGGDL